jgi:polysaccharide deacetylase family protein (PEP-CTERM system associated)
VLIEEGFAYDASIFPVRHDRYGIPGAPRHTHVRTTGAGTIIEVPGSTVRVAGVNIPIAGGGYFRLLPYAMTRWGFRRTNSREQRPVVFYLHPWEVDPAQPRIEAGALTRLRHYRNLHKTASRLRALMAEFAFSTIAQALSIPPADVPVTPVMPVPAWSAR